jgi:hypothetical protein
MTLVILARYCKPTVPVKVPLAVLPLSLLLP